jgi:hypothetical protein
VIGRDDPEHGLALYLFNSPISPFHFYTLLRVNV